MPGVAVAGSGGWDIATRGSAAYVALGVTFDSTRLWSAADGKSWTEQQPSCGVDAAVRLSTPQPGEVEASCSFDPRVRGYMTKQLVRSADGDAPVVLGAAPTEGITTAFAATPNGTAVIGAVGAGGSWLHASFDNGATWQIPLVVTDAELPISDLSFQDATDGVAVWGGPQWRGRACTAPPTAVTRGVRFPCDSASRARPGVSSWRCISFGPHPSGW